MLSSVAERVYWLGRYLERAESSARLLNVYSLMLLDLPRGSHIDWKTLLTVSGSQEAYAGLDGSTEERPVVKFLLMDASNTNSIFSSIRMGRENARTTREVIPSEVWVQINDLYLQIRDNLNPRLGRQARNETLEQIISNCQRIEGLFSSSMSHNTAYCFIELGRKVERADMTSRLVDVGSINLLPAFSGKTQKEIFIEPYQNLVWMNILRCLGAYQAYRQHVQNRVSGEEVVRFLLQDEHFPRAIGFCLDSLIYAIERLPNNENVKRAAVRVKRICREARIPELLEKGLLEYIDELQIAIADVHMEVSKTWFAPREPSQPQRNKEEAQGREAVLHN